MADFSSGFWSWYIAIGTLVSILVLFPLLYLNRDSAEKGDPGTTDHIWDDDLQEYNNPLPAWWFNMFVITLVYSLIYLVLYPGLGTFNGILGWTSVGQYENELQHAEENYGPLFARFAETSIPALSADADAMKAGERLFANYCAGCHGSDARGAPGYPNLRDNNWQWSGEPDGIKASILDGRTGVMVGWEAALGGDEGVDQVTQYVLSLSGRDHDAAAAAAGAPRYAQLCVACHAADGTGNQLLGAPDLTDRIWLYGGSPGTIADVIRNGRNGVMPPHREFLGEDKVHLLSAYVYGLSAEHEYE